MNFKRFIQENKKNMIFNGSILLFMNLYFYMLDVFKESKEEIYYLNAMLLSFYFVGLLLQYYNERRKYKKIYDLVSKGEDVELGDIMGEDLVEEIIRSTIIIKEQNFAQSLNFKKEQLKDLEEYLSKWIREIKSPISTLNMMVDQIEDFQLNYNLKIEIEKIKNLVNSVIYGGRATVASENIGIAEYKLEDIINQAIKNNAFMLLKSNMEVKLENLDYYIFCDKKWILYVLDQLIHNAIKYARKRGEIKFYADKKDQSICLNVRDDGVGICEEDMKRIFRKGFTGKNCRNTIYKSTGMGLYFSKKVLDTLGNSIEVQSIRNQYTIFKITFNKIADCANITKM